MLCTVFHFNKITDFYNEQTKNGQLLFSKNFTAKCEMVFIRKPLPPRGLISKPIEKSCVPLKNCNSDFRPPFKRSACFYVTITGHFERFQNFITSKQFSAKIKLILKNWSIVFQFRVLQKKVHYFRVKLPCQRPVLRQIEWGVQNTPITKNGLLLLTRLSF